MKKMREENEKMEKKMMSLQNDLDRSKKCLKEMSQPLFNKEPDELPSVILESSETNILSDQINEKVEQMKLDLTYQFSTDIGNILEKDIRGFNYQHVMAKMQSEINKLKQLNQTPEVS